MEVADSLEQLQAQIAEMAKHIERLEKRNAGLNGAAAVPVHQAAASTLAITEEELLAISAALGAYLGVRPHIRQIRLVSTTAWAQQGRVSIQASHRLQG
jgi:methylmalonyl-CoA carboxyltransferase large subunit